MRYEECWDFPIPIRKWWIKRVNQENEKKQKEYDKAKRSSK